LLAFAAVVEVPRVSLEKQEQLELQLQLVQAAEVYPKRPLELVHWLLA